MLVVSGLWQVSVDTLILMLLVLGLRRGMLEISVIRLTRSFLRVLGRRMTVLGFSYSVL